MTKMRINSYGFDELKSKNSRRKLQKMQDWQVQPIQGHGGLFQKRNNKVRCCYDYKPKFAQKVRADLQQQKKKRNPSARHNSQKVRKFNSNTMNNDKKFQGKTNACNETRKELDLLLVRMNHLFVLLF